MVSEGGIRTSTLEVRVSRRRIEPVVMLPMKSFFEGPRVIPSGRMPLGRGMVLEVARWDRVRRRKILRIMIGAGLVFEVRD